MNLEDAIAASLDDQLLKRRSKNNFIRKGYQGIVFSFDDVVATDWEIFELKKGDY